MSPATSLGRRSGDEDDIPQRSGEHLAGRSSGGRPDDCHATVWDCDGTDHLSASHPPDVLPLRSIYIGLSILALFLLVTRRRALSKRSCLAIFVAAIAPTYVLSWVANAPRVDTPTAPLLFLGDKLLVFIVAAIAPEPIWLGIVLIGASAVEAVIKAQQFHMAQGGEPWVTVVWAVAAIGLHVNRHQRIAAERDAARSRATAEAAAQLARAFLAVRDLANTPLQTLRNDLILMRGQCPVAGAALAARMDRAVTKLRKLQEILTGYEQATPLGPEDESFDSIETLTSQQPLRQQRPRATRQKRNPVWTWKPTLGRSFVPSSRRNTGTPPPTK